MEGPERDSAYRPGGSASIEEQLRSRLGPNPS